MKYCDHLQRGFLGFGEASAKEQVQSNPVTEPKRSQNPKGPLPSSFQPDGYSIALNALASFKLRNFRIDLRGQILFPICLVKKLAHFNLKKDYAVFCPKGQALFAEVSELMRRAVVQCRKEKIALLLIDSTRLPGLQPPGIAERFHFAERIASEAASSVKIAHVASRRWVHSGKFALMVAKNRGLDAKYFHSAATAVKWLLKSE
jgi:hypothetical protein